MNTEDFIKKLLIEAKSERSLLSIDIESDLELFFAEKEENGLENEPIETSGCIDWDKYFEEITSLTNWIHALEKQVEEFDVSDTIVKEAA